jgi:hypothetical protein
MAGGPSTGSASPIAMKLGPDHRVDQNSAAWRETAAPSMSGVTGTRAGKMRAPAL